MISILCPTRKRQEQFARMMMSAQDTAAHGVEVLAYVDTDDDPVRADLVVRGPRITMSNMWDRLAESAHGDILMMCADDAVFRTPRWDGVVQSAFAQVPDRILFAFGDDLGFGGKQFGTLGFVHRRWVDAVGYFTPHGFSGDYCDTWLNDVAKMIERHRPIDIVVEHMHWMYGKSERDQTYRDKDERMKRDDCTALYEARAPERERDAAKLRAVMT